jgi:hypothetical protein
LTGALKYGIIFERVGEVSEWFKELVLKTSDPARDQEFESLPLRHLTALQGASQLAYIIPPLEKYPSGEGAPLLRE